MKTFYSQLAQGVNRMSSSVLIEDAYRKFGCAMAKTIVAIVQMKVIADLLHQVLLTSNNINIENRGLNLETIASMKRKKNIATVSS